MALFQGNPGWWNIIIWPTIVFLCHPFAGAMAMLVSGSGLLPAWITTQPGKGPPRFAHNLHHFIYAPLYTTRHDVPALKVAQWHASPQRWRLAILVIQHVVRWMMRSLKWHRWKGGGDGGGGGSGKPLVKCSQLMAPCGRPMADSKLELLGIPYLVGKISRSNFFCRVQDG